MGDVPWMRDTHTACVEGRGQAVRWFLAARETTAAKGVDSRHKLLSGNHFHSKC